MSGEFAELGRGRGRRRRDQGSNFWVFVFGGVAGLLLLGVAVGTVWYAVTHRPPAIHQTSGPEVVHGPKLRKSGLAVAPLHWETVYYASTIRIPATMEEGLPADSLTATCEGIDGLKLDPGRPYHPAGGPGDTVFLKIHLSNADRVTRITLELR